MAILDDLRVSHSSLSVRFFLFTFLENTIKVKAADSPLLEHFLISAMFMGGVE